MFGYAIACYLAFGGAGGGLCLVAGGAGLCIPRALAAKGPLGEYRALLGWSFSAAAMLLVLAALLLLADAGNATALGSLLFSGRATYLTVGTWALGLCTASSAALAFLWRGGLAAWRLGAVRALMALAAVLSLAVIVYAGAFLASMRAVPLWSTPWLPPLFVFSSLSCGAGAFVAIARLHGVEKAFARFLRMVTAVDVAAVLLEALFAALLIASLLLAPGEGESAAAGAGSAWSLLAGEYAWAWWGGFAALGVAAPLAIDAVLLHGGRTADLHPNLAIVLAVCTLAGALMLRICLVMTGAHPAAGF